MNKKFEYAEHDFYVGPRDPLLNKILNGYGDLGWQVVSATPFMFLDNPQLINKWVVIFMREIE